MRTLKRKLPSTHHPHPSSKRPATTCPDPDSDLQFQDACSLRQRAEPYELATARMPFSALTTHWQRGKSRPLSPHHVARLLNLFLHGGDGRPPGVVRDAKENYLLVQSTKHAVQRMRDYLASTHPVNHPQDNAYGSSGAEVLSFLEWPRINGDVTTELMNGLHRWATLQEYVDITNGDPTQLWWTCIIYDRGEHQCYLVPPTLEPPTSPSWIANSPKIHCRPI